MDAAEGLLVGLFSGSTNDDGDYQRYVDSILDTDRRTLAGTAKIAILFVDRENPPPDAQWRKRIADASAGVRTHGAIFVLCAESPMVRGVLTAINWIRPTKYEVCIVGTVEATLAIVRDRRPSATARTAQMLEEMRGESLRTPGERPR